MKKKISLFLSAALCICLMLAGCGATPAVSESENNTGNTDTAQDKTLIFAAASETTMLSPLYMGSFNHQTSMLVYETLLKYEGGEVKGNLAEDFSFNEDGTVLTLNLRQNVTFHDGEPFNAEAVKANLEFDQTNPSSMALKAITDMVSVEATDEYTVTITYSHPYYAYLYDFCWPDVMGMVSPKMIVPGDFQTVQGVVGTGPYTYAEYVQGKYTRFERNENYWGEKPYYDEIIDKYIPDSTSRLQALKTGEIDMIFGGSLLSYEDYQQAIAINGIDGLIADMGTRARDITLNASSEKLQDVKVRQAIAYAIDKTAISDGLAYGYEPIAVMPFPEGTPYTDFDLNTNYSFDQDKANALLDEAGWSMGTNGVREKAGTPLSILLTVDASFDALNMPIATLIKSQLAEVGFEVNIKSQEQMEWYSGYMAGEFDMTFWPTQYEYASPHCFFTPMSMMTPQTASLSKVSDAQEFFDNITAVTQTDNPDEVQKIYNYLINYDLDNAIDIPLTYSKDMIVFNSNKIAGYTFDGAPCFFNPLNIKPTE
jgi:peptide/nickel transport system substrate-binding protein/nickel transport system substrate-binding protein